MSEGVQNTPAFKEAMQNLADAVEVQKNLVKEVGELKDNVKAKDEALAKAQEQLTALEKKYEDNQKAGMFSASRYSGVTKGEIILQSFGCESIKDAMVINTEDSKYKFIEPESRGQLRLLKEQIDLAIGAAAILNRVKAGGSEEAPRSSVTPDMIAGLKYFKQVITPMAKAYGVDSGDVGFEWIPTLFSSVYIPEFEIEMKVASLFQELRMPSNPFKLPVGQGITEAVGVGDDGTLSSQTITASANITLQAAKFGHFQTLPEDLNEDAAIATLEIARRESVLAHVRAFEQALVNGDTAGTHQDADTDAGAANLAAKQLNGLRKLGLANSGNGSTVDFNAADATAAKLLDLRVAMGKFGANVGDMALIMSVKTALKTLGIDQVLTVDKYGAMAKILTGEIGKIFGAPIIMSEKARDDLDATGVNSGVALDDTHSAILSVNRRRFYVGTRRPTQLAVIKSHPEQDVWKLGSYSRKAFAGHAQSATEKSVTVGVQVHA